jgi:predicted nucleotidyltransferase
MEISMNIKKNIIKKCPSDTHKQFLEYAFCFFQEKNCKAILKGSIQKDTAHKFSDIDLVLKRMDKELVREFIFNFGEVVLISRTQRPLEIDLEK